MAIELPRFVIAKKLASGKTGFYWNPPVYWKKEAAKLDRKFPFESQPLGTDLAPDSLAAAAERHNARFDEWREGGGNFGPGRPPAIRRYGAPGTVAWLIETYLAHEIFRRRVAERSRADYRRLFDAALGYPLKTGGKFGDLPIRSVTPAAAEKLYAWLIEGERFRRGEKAVMYFKTAWRLMLPHHPREFRKDVPNPWEGVQLVSWQRRQKPAHDRSDVYAFAAKAIEMGQPELGAAAVVCFEWLQRPENVIGGYVRWPDYRPGLSIKIEHHKTGERVTHPLREIDDEGEIRFYEDAEAILGQLPKRGIPMILRPDGTLYEATRFAQLVRKVADAAGLPKTFTLDACRHGGMTELEEAGLTDGQGRALSAHRSRAYEGYAKRTEKRMLAATKRRHAYRTAG
jgi:hypothetical protein